jgi:hypothetical protein
MFPEVEFCQPERIVAAVHHIRFLGVDARRKQPEGPGHLRRSRAPELPIYKSP